MPKKIGSTVARRHIHFLVKLHNQNVWFPLFWCENSQKSLLSPKVKKLRLWEHHKSIYRQILDRRSSTIHLDLKLNVLNCCFQVKSCTVFAFVDLFFHFWQIKADFPEILHTIRADSAIDESNRISRKIENLTGNMDNKIFCSTDIMLNFT